MGLDNDVYICLNTDWYAAIIEKPTLKVHPYYPDNAIARTTYITARDKGTINEASSDNTLDEKRIPFVITIYEANEDNAVKSIRCVKKALHEKSVSNGYYHVDGFEIDEQHKITKAVLNCSLVKMIAEDEF